MATFGERKNSKDMKDIDKIMNERMNELMKRSDVRKAIQKMVDNNLSFEEIKERLAFIAAFTLVSNK